MNVEVKLFAGAKQTAGRDTLSLALPDNATIADVRRALSEQLPALEPLVRRAMFSINLDYANDKTSVPANAEIACIPPVSGG